MRTDTIIAALRALLSNRWTHEDFVRAKDLVHDFDQLPTEPDIANTKDVVITTGAKDGYVIFQTSGNEDLEPSFFVWTPQSAREVIHTIQEAIKLAEGQVRK